VLQSRIKWTYRHLTVSTEMGRLRVDWVHASTWRARAKEWCFPFWSDKRCAPYGIQWHKSFNTSMVGPIRRCHGEEKSTGYGGRDKGTNCRLYRCSAVAEKLRWIGSSLRGYTFRFSGYRWGLTSNLHGYTFWWNLISIQRTEISSPVDYLLTALLESPYLLETWWQKIKNAHDLIDRLTMIAPIICQSAS
jgi:hypothetical protein